MNCVNFRIQITQGQADLKQEIRKLLKIHDPQKLELGKEKVFALKETLKERKKLLDEHRSWCPDCTHY